MARHRLDFRDATGHEYPPSARYPAMMSMQRMSAGAFSACAARLFCREACHTRDDAVMGGLGITEGVEDGLAVLLSGWSPIWAAGSAGAIRRFPILAGIDSLTIFADADSAGLEAAQECEGRWVTIGKEARIAAPARSRHA